MDDMPAPRLLALGDCAWTVQFGHKICPEIHARVIGMAERLAAIRQNDPTWAAVCDVVPTFRSLTVHFDPLSADADALGRALLTLAQTISPQPAHGVQGRLWHLPACFDAEFAPDLPSLAAAKGLRVDEVIDRLLQTVFRVYMIGFLPGFPYMGGLPAELAWPRRASPRPRVPAHSLAVAGEMCAVYPWDSPGGWHLLGRTPVPLFDLRHADEPAMLRAGDRVRWYAIDRADYEWQFEQSQRGEWQLESCLQPEAP